MRPGAHCRFSTAQTVLSLIGSHELLTSASEAGVCSLATAGDVDTVGFSSDSGT